MDPCGVLQGLADFVLLEMADEMPCDVRRELRGLFGELLHAVFSEAELPRVIGFFDDFRGEGLGDGEQACAVRRAAGLRQGVGDAFVDGFQIFGDHAISSGLTASRQLMQAIFQPMKGYIPYNIIKNMG